MKSKRLSAAVKFAAALFVLAAVSFTLGCPFYRLTGLKCPGCGVSRMILSVFRGEFSAAFFYNPVIFCLLPLWAVCLLLHYFSKRPRKGFENAVLYGSIAALAVFGVLRNIFPMGFPSV